MPLDIRAIEDDVARVCVEYAGERVNVEFVPSRMTFFWMDEVNALIDSPDSYRQAELVSEVITVWDIVDNGEPVPTTADGMMEVPLPVFYAVLKGIMEHVNSLSRVSRTGGRTPIKTHILEQIFGKDTSDTASPTDVEEK